MASSMSIPLVTSAITKGFTQFLRLKEKDKQDTLSIFEILDDPGAHSLMKYLRNKIEKHVENRTLSSDLDNTVQTSNDISTKMILVYVGTFLMVLILIIVSCFLRTKMKIEALPKNNISQALSEQSNSDYLVCLGDSLTHATVSANYIPLLENFLSSDKHHAHLKIINGGINSQLVYNLRQRIDDVLKLKPKVVTLMIGINDIKGLAVPKFGVDSKRRMNLPQIPTLEFFEENMKDVLQLLYNGLPSNSEIYVCSIPPLGEDVDSSYNAVHVTQANELLREMIETVINQKNNSVNNEESAELSPSIRYVPVFEECIKVLRQHAQIKDKKLVSFEKWSLRRTILTSLLHYTFGISWNTLGSKLYGYYIMIEGLHLNDRGAEIVARSIAATMQNLSLEDIRYSFNENI